MAKLDQVLGGGSSDLARCPKCEYKSPSRSRVRRHLQSHLDSPKNWRCKTCHYRFAEAHQLRRHLAKQHGSRKPGVLPLTPATTAGNLASEAKKAGLEEPAKQENKEGGNSVSRELEMAEQEVETEKKAMRKRIRKKMGLVEVAIIKQREEVVQAREKLVKLVDERKQCDVELSLYM
jgi:hypothetical protein